MRARTVVIAGLLTSCVAATALAQTRTDRSFTATSKDCSGIQWSQEALEQYPNIASACQGVEVRDGKTYVKFTGAVTRNIDRGKQLRIRFKGGDEATVTPPPDTHLYVRDRRTPVADLQRGDELTFHIAEDRLAAHFPDAPPAQVATRYVIVPIAVEKEPERMASLPATASELPLIALSGVLLLGLAAGLTIRRMLRR